MTRCTVRTGAAFSMGTSLPDSPSPPCSSLCRFSLTNNKVCFPVPQHYVTIAPVDCTTTRKYVMIIKMITISFKISAETTITQIRASLSRTVFCSRDFSFIKEVCRYNTCIKNSNYGTYFTDL